MPTMKKWCEVTDIQDGPKNLRILEIQSSKLAKGIASVAKVVPSHYASHQRIAGLLRTLGKEAAAKYIEQKLPTAKTIRSGDLGEILGTSYVMEFTEFNTCIHRLRWKDHREMAMRGEDILGVRAVASTTIEFLKGEAKSSVSLPAATVAKARAALAAHNGRPSPHALAFLSDRLAEEGNTLLTTLLDSALLTQGVKTDQVSHLMFAFSGKNPATLLRKDLDAYDGKIAQYSVGLYVEGHQDFINAVYNKVITDGH